MKRGRPGALEIVHELLAADHVGDERDSVKEGLDDVLLSVRVGADCMLTKTTSTAGRSP